MRMGKLLRLLIAFVIVAAVALVGLAVQVNIWLQPVPVLAQEPVLVSIPSGASLIRIAGILAEHGLVRNATVFRYYARYRNLDQRLQAGDYIMHYGMTMDEILQRLARGDVIRNTVTVTIPEGYNLEQIAAGMEAAGLVLAEEFLAAAAAVVPASGRVTEGLRYTLEGYLFPDTYEFEPGVSAEQIITRMQNRLAEIMTADLRERAAELDMDLHTVLTMASLVEREGRVESEFPLIASVIYNRLAKNMLLQIDATVIYALGEHRSVVLLEDLEVDSPYNTYKYKGLPPGPIASPGKAAIMAVLYPEESDYLYYVVKGDGSGEHYFGRTLAEHEANKRKSRENKKNSG
ncbi:MAG TPA: endolytic transglycosylase MltG [Firmicutes bacterium]|nr:endolytic transglycosylase MltG [Bacillota bacterium]